MGLRPQSFRDTRRGTAGPSEDSWIPTVIMQVFVPTPTPRHLPLSVPGTGLDPGVPVHISPGLWMLHTFSHTHCARLVLPLLSSGYSAHLPSAGLGHLSEGSPHPEFLICSIVSL